MADTLVLDMAGVPVGFVSWQRAIKLIWEERASVLCEDANRILHSPNFEVNMPTVIRAKNWVKRRKKAAVPFSRRSIAIRDNSECQYCGRLLKTEEYTLDHVVPRCQGGLSTWTNLVRSGIKCNKYKSVCTPKEAGMILRKQPAEPRPDDPRFNFKLRIKKMHPTWKPWGDGGWLYAEKAAYAYWNVELEP